MNMETHHDHSPEGIRARLAADKSAVYLREWVYGGIDGVVTTFAIVAGVVGASLSPSIVLILGLANLIGDGFSMAAAAYSATETENDNYKRLREVEISHISRYPEGEREEIRQIYAAKGFAGEDLEKIVQTITKNQDLWIDVMMAEEHGLTGIGPSAFKAGLNTFLAFVFCGVLPLIPFICGTSLAFELALLFSGLAFFAIGAFKSRWSVKSWWWHGCETLFIGLLAAGMAFAIGYVLREIGVDV